MPPALNRSSSLGAIELGILVSTLLFGVTTLQSYLYFRSTRARKDRLHVRALVAGVWVIEATHTGFIWSYLYNATVVDFGNERALLRSPWQLALSVPLASIVGLAVHSFFSSRIHYVSGKLWLALPGYVLALMSVALTFALGVKSLKEPQLGIFVHEWRWLLTLAITNTMVLDVYNVAVLSFHLHNRKGEFANTSAVLDQLIRWTFETGIVISISSMVILTCELSMPGNTIWLGVQIFHAKLYSNTLLVFLNGCSTLARSEKPVSVQLGEARPHSGRASYAWAYTVERTTDAEVFGGDNKTVSDGRSMQTSRE